jgi:DNA-directed RNA polymerase specialized sigma24 family protein
MMDIDVLHQRLLAWAAWLTGGGGGCGYPTKSVLHSSWLPPAPGSIPAMRTSSARSSAPERELHAIIRQTLSVRLQNTLAVVYLMRASASEQAVLLECQPSTVRARLGEAKRLIALALQSADAAA